MSPPRRQSEDGARLPTRPYWSWSQFLPRAIGADVLFSPVSAKGWSPVTFGSSVAAAWPLLMPCTLPVQCALIAVLAIPVAAWTGRRTARIERVGATLPEAQRRVGAPATTSW